MNRLGGLINTSSLLLSSLAAGMLLLTPRLKKCWLLSHAVDFIFVATNEQDGSHDDGDDEHNTEEQRFRNDSAAAVLVGNAVAPTLET
mmetsp:Transcript_58/g.152  ORF Transcript_58/g.152 Transcript_58/m.152 type:complete len:88 (+) Transcript_58:1188-1451(+)